MYLIHKYVYYRNGISKYNNWFSKKKRFLCFSLSTKMPARVCLAARWVIAIHITVTWHMASILHEANSLQVCLYTLCHTLSQCNISPPNDQVRVINVKVLPCTVELEAKICKLHQWKEEINYFVIFTVNYVRNMKSPYKNPSCTIYKYRNHFKGNDFSDFNKVMVNK